MTVLVINEEQQINVVSRRNGVDSTKEQAAAFCRQRGALNPPGFHASAKIHSNVVQRIVKISKPIQSHE